MYFFTAPCNHSISQPCGSEVGFTWGCYAETLYNPHNPHSFHLIFHYPNITRMQPYNVKRLPKTHSPCFGGQAAGIQRMNGSIEGVKFEKEGQSFWCLIEIFELRGDIIPHLKELCRDCFNASSGLVIRLWITVTAVAHRQKREKRSLRHGRRTKMPNTGDGCAAWS